MSKHFVSTLWVRMGPSTPFSLVFDFCLHSTGVGGVISGTDIPHIFASHILGFRIASDLLKLMLEHFASILGVKMRPSRSFSRIFDRWPYQLGVKKGLIFLKMVIDFVSYISLLVCLKSIWNSLYQIYELDRHTSGHFNSTHSSYIYWIISEEEHPKW